MASQFPGFGGGSTLREFKESHASGPDGSAGGEFPAFTAGQVVQEKNPARPKTIESGVVVTGKG